MPIVKDRADAEAVAIIYDGSVIDPDREIASIVADLSYALKLPMADSIILPTVRTSNVTL